MSDTIYRQAAIAHAVPLNLFGREVMMVSVSELENLPSAQPEIIYCKDCKHFHYDMPYLIQGVPILGHEVCDFWGDGCKTSENGFCSYAERRQE